MPARRRRSADLPPLVRHPPLERAALRTALIDGLAFYCRLNGMRLPDLGAIADQQMAKISRACRTEAVPPAPAAPVQDNAPPRWWDRD